MAYACRGLPTAVILTGTSRCCIDPLNLPNNCRSTRLQSPDMWERETRQVYARLGGPDGRLIYMPDGSANRPDPNDPQGRTFKALTVARQMWCPIEGCEPFKTVVQETLRTHFRHEDNRDTDSTLNRTGFRAHSVTGVPPFQRLHVQRSRPPRIRPGVYARGGA